MSTNIRKIDWIWIAYLLIDLAKTIIDKLSGS